MIIRREDMQDVCTKILSAVDSSELSAITETLELVTEESVLSMIVTNREYIAKVKLAINTVEDFHATVNANLFLKLISQITTDSIELNVKDNSLVINGNGTYKLPLVYDGEELLKLPDIVINNVTNTFNIKGEILNSILTYNSKELSKGTIVRPVQKLYYVDNEGAITFTNGACVNKFELEKPVKVLLNQRIVKLFKLFKDENVAFTLGHDAISGDAIQTKVRFETSNISITAILTSDDTLFASVPVEAIRHRATKTYPMSVTFNKDALVQTINRLLLFTNAGKNYVKPYSKFEFKSDRVIIYDNKGENKEELYYENDDELTSEYINILDLVDVKTTLESCTEQHVTINFGDNQAIVVARGSVYNVIPEVINS